ncbi:CoA ester lyase [Labrenzia aggregata]|uniref:CoA ester lyase n=2 Tax=Roseibium aggregatum TaxID=187304 RepID=A0A926NTV1_9HYPH|nr:CoA ester lyase [Roseibium aggregatum]MBD1546349.1 CoA ester lyase [Roseibium aggregatum]
MTDAICLPLFVPGNRPDRFAKAAAAGSGMIILDLEDAVVAGAKAEARDAVVREAGAFEGTRVFVRVNGADTPWFEDDISAVTALAIDGIVVPKAENPEIIREIAKALGPGREIWALIESVRGMAKVRDIAGAADRIVFGSVDFCADLGMAHEREILLPFRLELAMAARLAGKPAPVDGVTTVFDKADLVTEDAVHARALGYGGKLLIHPKQIEPARAGFRPTEAEVETARRILQQAEGVGAVAVDGQMIDEPVLIRARDVLARWEALS